jgi:hypothetical protein
MGDDLMTEKVEIDPVIARAAFGTAEQIAVENAGLRKVAYRKRKMKAWTF